jgi:hypothetical protein
MLSSIRKQGTQMIRLSSDCVFTLAGENQLLALDFLPSHYTCHETWVSWALVLVKQEGLSPEMSFCIFKIYCGDAASSVGADDSLT